MLIVCSSADAHEYWIEADNYRPDPGQVVALTTRVGQGFTGDEVLNIKLFYSDYSVVTRKQRKNVSGSLATTPPAYIETPVEGSYIVGQRTRRSRVEMDPQKFSAYLEKQGLEHVLQAVDWPKSDESPITENYSRCVKAIIQSGPEPETDILSEALGYTLEIIPYSNPAQTQAGDLFRIQLLYEGKPLQNSQITALNKQYPEQAIKSRTDSEGYAQIVLPYGGIWMLNTVHIIAAQETDWESFWANLTFEVSL